MINLIKEIIKNNSDFIKFVIVGLSNLFISLVTYYILVYFSINYQIANIGGFITGSINGYILNKIWVFRSSEKNVSSVIRFYLTYLCSWILSAILLCFWIEVMKISDMVAPVINVFITTPINYLLNKYWVFKKVNSNKNFNEKR